MCPYCFEYQDKLVDFSIENQTFIEDCEVCCSPIIVNVTINSDEEILVSTRTENE